MRMYGEERRTTLQDGASLFAKTISTCTIWIAVAMILAIGLFRMNAC
jgi:hypothetical protein